MLGNPKENLEIERAEQVASEPAVLANYKASVAPASGDSDSLSELSAPLWRRKGTIAVAAILGLMAGQVISLLTTPTFRARTSMQIEGFNDEFLRSITPISPQI